jgi:hypothetical protein
LTSTPLSALPSFQSPFNSTLPAFQTPTTPTTTSLTPVSESKAAEKSKKATEAERDDDDQQQDEEAAEVVVEDTNNVPEGQELLHRSGRAKLYLFESGNREWKERGIGRVSVLKTIESGAVSPPNVFCFLSRFLIHSFPLISVCLSLSLFVQLSVIFFLLIFIESVCFNAEHTLVFSHFSTIMTVRCRDAKR